ncbi:MAG: threonine transporter [Phycisphaeraceae bacterium]|nr:threonine transporter [Phycisphaeraceae bacterium]
MNLYDTLILTLIMLLLAAIPSSSVGLVVVRSATHNIRHGIATTLGIVTGDLIFVLLAIMGLTTLSQWLGSVFTGFRYLASGYLLWLGFDLIHGGLKNTKTNVQPASGHYANSYLAGLLLTLGDIKAILFYASLFPVFVDVTTLGMWDIALILLITTVSVGSVKLAYAYAAKAISVRTRQLTYQRPAKLTAGSLLIGLGGYLLVKN